jgi:hypothetical protein
MVAPPQHFLYFFPEPHGHGSFRPTLEAVCQGVGALLLRTMASPSWSLMKLEASSRQITSRGNKPTNIAARPDQQSGEPRVDDGNRNIFKVRSVTGCQRGMVSEHDTSNHSIA